MFDVGILVIRVLFGVAIAAHGAQKLFGWFGGYGLKGTGGFFEGFRFPSGGSFAAAAGGREFGGGGSLALGLFPPFRAPAVLSALVVALGRVSVKIGFLPIGNWIK